MTNLVKNQHGSYTYRKYVNGKSLRVSLLTSDKLEAFRIVEKLNSIIAFALSSDPNQVRAIVLAVLNELQPQFNKERISRVQSLLGISLENNTGEMLSVITQSFIDEKVRSKAWSSGTLDKYSVVLKNLIDLVGDKGIRGFSHRDAQTVKSSLQKLPSNLNKKAAYRDKSIKQILTMAVPESDLMSIKTVNMALGCYSELFKWSIKNGFVGVNVFEGLGIRDNRIARDLRQPFTPSDLKTLFSAQSITHSTHPWQYWIPVLGLYTGARLNEICQLQYKDVFLEQGIWIISINDDGDKQYLKSASSKRIIPVHNELVRLGFIKFIDKGRGARTALIFPELTVRNDRYAHIPSQWFGRVKAKYLSNSEKKSFHSLRHTFVDFMFNKLKLQGNPIVKVLVGHTDKEVTSGVYGSAFEIADLDAVIQRLDFSEYGIEIQERSWST